MATPQYTTLYNRKTAFRILTQMYMLLEHILTLDYGAQAAFPNDFERHSAQKAAQLLKHGYPKTLLFEAIMRAHEQKREDLLTPKEKPSNNEEKNQIFLTTNKDHPGLREQVELTWELLGRSSQTRFILDKTLKVDYRSPKSLNDLLVWARLPPETTPCQHDNPRRQESNKRCKKKNCRYCQCLNTDKKNAHMPLAKHTLHGKKADWLSNNLVYCISCTSCSKQYVGQTKNSLNKRFQAHFYLIKHQKIEHEVPLQYHEVPLQ